MKRSSDKPGVGRKIIDLGPALEKRRLENEYKWANRAVKEAQGFMADIDPDFQIRAEPRVFRPSDGGEESRIYAVAFSHATDPLIRWTMDAPKDDEYYKNDFERVVREVYEKSKKLSDEHRWSEKAVEAAKNFIGKIDPDLRVNSEERIFTPKDGGKESRVFVLVFSHAKKPWISWSMNASQNEDYYVGDFEKTVRNIYSKMNR